MAKDKKDQKKLPKSVIAGIIAAAVIVVGLIIWVVVSIIVANQPLEQDWAQRYYEYLQEHKLPSKSQTVDGDDYDVSEYEMGFYDVEGVDEPVMVVSYLDVEGKRQLTYYYQKDGEVAYETWMQGTNLALLYDIDRKAYDYYIHRTNEGEELYTSLAEDVIHHRDGITEAAETQIFKADDVTKVTKTDGTELSMTKFEQTFVPVEDMTKTTRMPVNYNDSDLKGAMREDTRQIRTIEDVARDMTEKINKMVDDALARQAEIEQAQQEIAEAEAKAKAEEEARRGFWLEGKFITYGTYRWVEDMMVAGSLIINRDGTCVAYEEPNCTWYIGKKDYAQDVSTQGKHIHDSIIFKWGANGYESGYYAYGDNEIGDGDLGHYKLTQAQE